MTDAVTAPGLVLRPAPAGMPDPALHPPVVAQSGDPFTTVRVVDLVARIPRGEPIRVADLAARLEATYLDWHFPLAVVIDVALQLQANWMADYRNTSGVVVADGPHGPTLSLEDSPRVDPWVVRQAERAATDCREVLLEASRRDRPTGDG